MSKLKKFKKKRMKTKTRKKRMKKKLIVSMEMKMLTKN
jgi:hypothetical protein